MALRHQLLAPVRRVRASVDAVDSIAEATCSLPGFERALTTQLSTLLARVGELTGHVEQLPAPVTAIALELSVVTADVRTIGPRLDGLEAGLQRVSGQLAELQASLDSLSRTVKDATEHLPDDEDAGIIARTRDAIAGVGS